MERMHDLSYFRANFERIAERLATRGNIAARGKAFGDALEVSAEI